MPLWSLTFPMLSCDRTYDCRDIGCQYGRNMYGCMIALYAFLTHFILDISCVEPMGEMPFLQLVATRSVCTIGSRVDHTAVSWCVMYVKFQLCTRSSSGCRLSTWTPLDTGGQTGVRPEILWIIFVSDLQSACKNASVCKCHKDYLEKKKKKGHPKAQGTLVNFELRSKLSFMHQFCGFWCYLMCWFQNDIHFWVKWNKSYHNLP